MSAAAKMPDPHANAIDALAHQLAESMAAATQHQAVLDAAEKHRDAIAGRISALSAERAGIVARRAGENPDPEDGARLALIGADLEGLAAMQPDAMARVEHAKRAFDAASNRAAMVRQEIDQTEARALHEALVPYVDELAAKLTAALKALSDVGKRAGIGGRPPWGASRELRDTLRTLALHRGEL